MTTEHHGTSCNSDDPNVFVYLHPYAWQPPQHPQHFQTTSRRPNSRGCSGPDERLDCVESCARRDSRRKPCSIWRSKSWTSPVGSSLLSPFGAQLSASRRPDGVTSVPSNGAWSCDEPPRPAGQNTVNAANDKTSATTERHAHNASIRTRHELTAVSPVERHLGDSTPW